jgi:hypothetical protein
MISMIIVALCTAPHSNDDDDSTYMSFVNSVKTSFS